MPRDGSLGRMARRPAAGAAGRRRRRWRWRVALPRSFFEDWGWLGRAGRMGRMRARRRARCCGCRSCRCSWAPRSPGLPMLLGVAVGVHWLGAPLGLAVVRLRGAGGSPARRHRPSRWRPDGPRAARPGRARHRRVEGASAAGSPPALVAEGARVAIASRSEERIQAAAAEIGARGYAFDAGDLDAVPALIERGRGATSGRSTSTSPTPAARRRRRPARLHARAVGGRAPHRSCCRRWRSSSGCCRGCASAASAASSRSARSPSASRSTPCSSRTPTARAWSRRSRCSRASPPPTASRSTTSTRARSPPTA